MATIDLPASLSSRVMNALKADARTVDLRGQAAHFFTLGARMLELFEEEEMADVLSDVSYCDRVVVEDLQDEMSPWVL
jgi:GINS complex subunit 3